MAALLDRLLLAALARPAVRAAVLALIADAQARGTGRTVVFGRAMVEGRRVVDPRGDVA